MNTLLSVHGCKGTHILRNNNIRQSQILQITFKTYKKCLFQCTHLVHVPNACIAFVHNYSFFPYLCTQ